MPIEKLDAARDALEHDATHFGAALQVIESATEVLEEKLKDLGVKIEEEPVLQKVFASFRSAHESLVPVGALAAASPTVAGTPALALHAAVTAPVPTVLTPSGGTSVADGPEYPAPADVAAAEAVDAGSTDAGDSGDGTSD